MVKTENDDRPTDEVSFTHQEDPTDDDGEDNEEQVDQLDEENDERTGQASASKPQRVKAPADDCSEITTENAPDGTAVLKVKEINDEITMTFPQKVRATNIVRAVDCLQRASTYA
jgi:hypothetical protein